MAKHSQPLTEEEQKRLKECITARAGSPREFTKRMFAAEHPSVHATDDQIDSMQKRLERVLANKSPQALTPSTANLIAHALELDYAGLMSRIRGDMSQSAEQMAGQLHQHSWVKTKSEIADQELSEPSVTYEREILGKLNKFRENSHIQAEEAAGSKIRHIMGTLTERFHATSSWLFLKKNFKSDPWIDPNPGCILKMEFHHNTGIDELELTTGAKKENGIVGYVALIRRPYFANNVKNPHHRDPHYRDDNTSTHSEIAVPILITAGDGAEQLIGVFNLESSQKDAFVCADIGELMAAATALAPHILVWQRLQADPLGFGWHPEAHGWTPERLLAGLCNAVAFSQGMGVTSSGWPVPSCTIWYFDTDAPDSERLHVRATSRFDHEYMTTHRLPKDSFVGITTTQLAVGCVAMGRPNVELRSHFQRKHKATRMDLAFAFASPISLPRQNQRPAIGSVVAYFFKNDLERFQPKQDVSPKEWFPWKLMVQLASEVGSLVANVQRLRKEVAAAHLRYRLSQDAVAGLTDFDIAKDVIVQCMGCEGGSIFARDDRHLICVATTGLIRDDGTSVAPDTAIYDMDNDLDKGLTSYLGQDDAQPIRRRSVHIRNFAGQENTVRPVNKFRENFVSVETHRPFLGIPVKASDHPNAPTVGAIRLVRNYQAKPFVKGDEELLQVLARECWGAFELWRQIKCKVRRESEARRLVGLGARYPFLVSALGEVGAPGKWRAVERLGSAFPAGACWNHHQVDEVLRDLINIFRHPDPSLEHQGGAFVASLRFKLPEVEGFQVYSIHSLRSAEPPDETREEMQRNKKNSVGLAAIRDLMHPLPVTFHGKTCEDKGSYASSLPEWETVVSGLCMPVRSVSQHGVFWGVLSLGRDDFELADWKGEHLEVVALAVKHLDFVGRDNRFLDKADYSDKNWSDAYAVFLEALRKAEVEACIAGGPFPELSESLRHRTEACKSKLIPGDKEILCDRQQHAFKIPLWYGPFRSDLMLCGYITGHTGSNRQTDEEIIRIKVAEAMHMWNRFASTFVAPGVHRFFDLRFKPGSETDGIVRWEPRLTCRFGTD